MRDIDPEDIESGNLSYDEAVWLRDRGKLPIDYDMPENDEEEDKDPEPPKSRVTPLENQEVPTIGDNGGIVEEGEEDYDEGWNNNQRRAELSKRGLSLEGAKSELMARLRRSDVDELIDGDEA